MQQIKENVLVGLLKITGIISGVALTTWTTYTQLLKDQPADVQASMYGVFVLSVVAFIYLKWIKRKIDHKLQAIEVADELNIVGRTGTVKRAILNFAYLVYPLIILYVFALGVERYQGNALSTNVMYLIVSIGVGSGIFSGGIALERRYTYNESLLNKKTEMDTIAQKVVEYSRKVGE